MGINPCSGDHVLVKGQFHRQPNIAYFRICADFDLLGLCDSADYPLIMGKEWKRGALRWDCVSGLKNGTPEDNGYADHR